MSRWIATAAVIGMSVSFVIPVGAVDEAGWAELKQLYITHGDDGAIYIALSPEAAGKRPSLTGGSTPSTTMVGTDETAVGIDETDVGTGGLADLSAGETRSVQRTVYPRGKTQIYLSDLNDGNTIDDDLYVSLTVPSRAVDHEVLVTMTVIGNRLSDLVIAFQPGGLVFNIPATLWVKMGTELVDLETTDLAVWHEYEDGSIEETTMHTSKIFEKGSYEFTAEVPGFSRYGLRR